MKKKRKGADFFDISDTLADGHMRYVEIVCISKFSQCHSFKSITKMASLLSGPGCSDAHLENIFAPKVFQVTRNSCWGAALEPHRHSVTSREKKASREEPSIKRVTKLSQKVLVLKKVMKHIQYVHIMPTIPIFWRAHEHGKMNVFIRIYLCHDMCG